jgi:hypothetical protein
MQLDPKTVETCQARIREKLGFQDTGEMRQAAVDWGHSQRWC